MSKNPLQLSFLSLRLATPESLATQLAETANAGNEVLEPWVREIADKGLTKRLESEIEAAVAELRIPTRPSLKNGKVTWSREYPARLPLRAGYALALLRVIEADLVPRIHRCVLSDCGKFYIGAPQSKWCSETCGSKYRVRAKRKRDQQ